MFLFVSLLASAVDRTMFGRTSAPIVRSTGETDVKGKLAITASILMAAISGTAMAQEAARVPLAMGLSTGMTKEEAKSVLPKMGNVAVIEGCSGEVAPVYKAKALAFMRVVWISGRKERQCDEVILAALRAKYGEPEITDGSNECDFNTMGCGWSGLASLTKSPVEWLVDQADATNGKRYLRFKSATVIVDVQQNVASRWIDLVYRPNVAASVTAEDASKL